MLNIKEYKLVRVSDEYVFETACRGCCFEGKDALCEEAKKVKECVVFCNPPRFYIFVAKG